MHRRVFLKITAAAASSFVLTPKGILAADEPEPELFKISLAEWSLHRALKSGKLTNLDFPLVAKRDYGIDCVEFVDQFFADKSQDTDYLTELKKRADGEGVRCGLLMLDTNGPLGASDKAVRDAAVEKTLHWIDAAKTLGCRTVRVNAYGEGSADELRQKIVESCLKLAEFAGERGINLAIENHGKLSSDPVWLTSVIRQVNKPNFGTLPDFGNFPAEVNRYEAVEMMMPYAKAVSAKATRFSPTGLIEDIHYTRMMRIVRDGGYHGYVGIESVPSKEELEPNAIRWTRDALLRIREEQSKCKPIFNGKDLAGWTKIEGGEWLVRNGELIGRHGVNWEGRSGSWLSSEREYGDFRLELQYNISPKGNSGVFIRSSHEGNPSYTGFEMQIFDAPGTAPTKQGPGALFDVAAPEKNLVRPAGQWNTVTIVAKGPKISMEMNGEKVLETTQTRSLRGYIGFQNHDEKSECRFRNIRLQEL